MKVNTSRAGYALLHNGESRLCARCESDHAGHRLVVYRHELRLAAEPNLPSGDDLEAEEHFVLEALRHRLGQLGVIDIPAEGRTNADDGQNDGADDGVDTGQPGRE